MICISKKMSIKYLLVEVGKILRITLLNHFSVEKEFVSTGFVSDRIYSLKIPFKILLVQ